MNTSFIEISKGKSWYKIYPLDKLEEDKVWTDDIKPRLAHLSKNVLAIWNYGFTEMLNNAIEHSDGTKVLVCISNSTSSDNSFSIDIADDGIGLFKKIEQELDLDDECHVKVELSKGKLTTNKQNHSGEGIFFTSRAFDAFMIMSNGTLYFNGYDFSAGRIQNVDKSIQKLVTGLGFNGSWVALTLENSLERNMQQIFERYTTDFAFDKTVVPVHLAQPDGDMLVSRSQAKRVVARLDQFKHVTFDFQGVEEIGQAFADEIFRVFKNKHPLIELEYVNADEAVEKMIRRARAANS